ncbi:MAG: TIGR00730 family Rossman fold protein [Bacteroidales bacterium]|nr:TIGR00730 family Rossman fold protein [Bacteroidales bacterium]MCF8389111.1 TIGR00730 family Rossman fold protein [Bacteroidales bacterium]
MKNIKRVAIFCASSPGVDDIYFDVAENLTRELINNDIAINYGGGGIGLMGKIADTALEMGGNIKGIIPVFMKEMEWAHKGVKDMILVRDMHERKYRLKKDIDAIITLPGGVGTMDELMEFISLKQLGQFTKPIIIVNTNGFYDPLFELLARMISQKFMRDSHSEIWTVVSDPSEVIDAIIESPPWDAEAIKFAAVKKH